MLPAFPGPIFRGGVFQFGHRAPRNLREAGSIRGGVPARRSLLLPADAKPMVSARAPLPLSVLSVSPYVVATLAPHSLRHWHVQENRPIRDYSFDDPGGTPALVSGGKARGRADRASG